MKLFSPISKSFLAIAAAGLLYAGCNDDDDPIVDPEEPVVSITSIDPTAGPVGTEVEISGENFGDENDGHVIVFNGTEAEITSVTDNLIVVIVPEGATTGRVDLTLGGKTIQGPTFTVTTVEPEISITSINPTEGAPGTMVTITGTGFGDELADHVVYFNGVEAEITEVSDTEIIVTVPADATTGMVSLEMGEETIEGPEFTVTEPEGPITALTPNSGTPGMSVIISGSGFGSEITDHEVSFNGEVAEITKIKDTEITVTVPEGATTGEVSLSMGGETFTGPVFRVLNEEELGEVIDMGEGFTMDAGLVTKGSAFIYQNGGPDGSTVLRLTPAAPDREGTAFYGAKVSVENGFETTFDFRIFRPGRPEGEAGEVGAEGFAFVIQNEGLGADGFSGGSMGYAGIENGIAIEFDVYDNQDGEHNMLDPNGNHISVQANTDPKSQFGPIRAETYHSLGYTTNEANPDLPDFIGNENSSHTARVVYNPTPGLLQIFLDDMTTPVLEIEMSLSDYINMSNGKAYVGFTSATSPWGWTANDILNWTFQPSTEGGADE